MRWDMKAARISLNSWVGGLGRLPLQQQSETVGN